MDIQFSRCHGFDQHFSPVIQASWSLKSGLVSALWHLLTTRSPPAFGPGHLLCSSSPSGAEHGADGASLALAHIQHVPKVSLGQRPETQLGSNFYSYTCGFSVRHRDHRITESQNGRGWKGALWVI